MFPGHQLFDPSSDRELVTLMMKLFFTGARAHLDAYSKYVLLRWPSLWATRAHFIVPLFVGAMAIDCLVIFHAFSFKQLDGNTVDAHGWASFGVSALVIFAWSTVTLIQSGRRRVALGCSGWARIFGCYLVISAAGASACVHTYAVVLKARQGINRSETAKLILQYTLIHDYLIDEMGLTSERISEIIQLQRAKNDLPWRDLSKSAQKAGPGDGTPEGGYILPQEPSKADIQYLFKTTLGIDVNVDLGESNAYGETPFLIGTPSIRKDPYSIRNGLVRRANLVVESWHAIHRDRSPAYDAGTMLVTFREAAQLLSLPSPWYSSYVVILIAASVVAQIIVLIVAFGQSPDLQTWLFPQLAICVYAVGCLLLYAAFFSIAHRLTFSPEYVKVIGFCALYAGAILFGVIQLMQVRRTTLGRVASYATVVLVALFPAAFRILAVSINNRSLLDDFPRGAYFAMMIIIAMLSPAMQYFLNRIDALPRV